MSILQIVVLAIAAILVNLLQRGRSYALLTVSALAMYWLQPRQEPVNLVFWFPTLTILLTVASWLVTSAPEIRFRRENWGAAAVLFGVVLLVDLNRYFRIEQFFPIETPRIQLVLAVILVFTAAVFALARLRRNSPFLLVAAICILIVMLVLMKVPSAVERLIEIAAGIRGKEAGEVIGLAWLGFSYVAFRLLHTLLDRRAGRLPPVRLDEYVNYVIFFPSFTAGPIDRIERFIRDLNKPLTMSAEGWMEAGKRLFCGLFKKFVVADGLAWFAMNELFAPTVQSAGWMWVLLYAYSLRIYFDFSGYTDIAIGLGQLVGVRLPENFDAPYLKPNPTQFWNAWHMTLAQWFRSYFFNPLTRALRSSRRSLPQPLLILFAQSATMILIGLWHGITPGFFLWGLWHGAGLFVHNRWSEWRRTRPIGWGDTPHGAAFLKYSGIVLNFHFVTLGWCFFLLPDPCMAWNVLLRIFGVL
jgi:D-alanyl-lipoteichoic acid acyltransferase DltB (MBOAT superfamily)